MPLRFAAETGRLFLDAILFYPLLSRSLPPASPAVSPHQTSVIFLLIPHISLSCLNSEFNPYFSKGANCNTIVKFTGTGTSPAPLPCVQSQQH